MVLSRLQSRSGNLVKLLPWQEAVISDLLIERKASSIKTVVPFNGDMTDRQAPHDEPSMVLFASINNQLRPLSTIMALH